MQILSKGAENCCKVETKTDITYLLHPLFLIQVQIFFKSFLIDQKPALKSRQKLSDLFGSWSLPNHPMANRNTDIATSFSYKNIILIYVTKYRGNWLKVTMANVFSCLLWSDFIGPIKPTKTVTNQNILFQNANLASILLTFPCVKWTTFRKVYFTVVLPCVVT